MKFLKHITTTAIAIGVLTVGAFGFDQKNNGQRPPKEPKVVREQPKDQPPPRNDNRGGDRGDRGNNDNKRGRP